MCAELSVRAGVRNLAEIFIGGLTMGRPCSVWLFVKGTRGAAKVVSVFIGANWSE